MKRPRKAFLPAIRPLSYQRIRGSRTTGKGTIVEGSIGAINEKLFDVGDRLGGIKAFRTGWRAIEDFATTVKLEGVVEFVEPGGGRLVPTIGNPAISLQERCWS